MTWERNTPKNDRESSNKLLLHFPEQLVCEKKDEQVRRSHASERITAQEITEKKAKQKNRFPIESLGGSALVQGWESECAAGEGFP